jgi:NMD protein affecting ribosome stability and mRNA decay
MANNGICQKCGKIKNMDINAYCDECADRRFKILFKKNNIEEEAVAFKVAKSWIDKLEIVRATTFPGIAQAMGDQWGNLSDD